jgi:hypothetical protein
LLTCLQRTQIVWLIYIFAKYRLKYIYICEIQAQIFEDGGKCPNLLYRLCVPQPGMECPCSVVWPFAHSRRSAEFHSTKKFNQILHVPISNTVRGTVFFLHTTGQNANCPQQTRVAGKQREREREKPEFPHPSAPLLLSSCDSQIHGDATENAPQGHHPRRQRVRHAIIFPFSYFPSIYSPFLIPSAPAAS